MLSTSLSPAGLRLLRLIQQLNFGRLEGLEIRKGEPDWNSPPRIVREIKFGADNTPRSEATHLAFELKAKAVEFFRYLKSLDAGTITVLEIQNGLPSRMMVEEIAA